ncbi:kelch motif family protein [Stylonychia lemnae]|uniref:Kelch motif family protein n=1 Tax=Stylonychia lemnae TaxID=5949 RepID=A0A077ZYR5_STYLE|nr:kelch motif family protein [Stylonychia lemnae]|eukprot:CDW74757.1 kelch motif family protein [Stylonychia lemnae]
MLPQINSCLVVGQTSFRGNESPFLQRMKYIEPRGRSFAPLEINIKSNEGLLQDDQNRLTQLVTKFEQRRLRSLIKEPSDKEDTGFYSKIQGYQAKPKVYNKRNYDFLAATLKQNSIQKTLAYTIELDDDKNDISPIDDQVLSTNTDSLRPVTNVKEKEKLQNMIKQSKFLMTPLELKQLKDTIRISQQGIQLMQDSQFNDTNITKNYNTSNGFFSSRRRQTFLSHKPSLVQQKSNVQIPKLSPRLKDLYNSHSQELKQILMNKLNSSSVRDLQMTKLTQQVDENQTQDLADIIDEQYDETSSIINHQDQNKTEINLAREQILNPYNNIYSFNIDTINDKIYFQRVEKETSKGRDGSNPRQSDGQGGFANLTSQGFIQDYDKPNNENQKYMPGQQTIMGLPENLNEIYPQIKSPQTTKKEEIKDKDIELHYRLKQKFSGSVDMAINQLDIQYLDENLENRKKEEAKKFIGGRKMKIKIPQQDESKQQAKDLIDEYAYIKDEQSAGRALEGIWMSYTGEGQFPSSREGAGAVAIDDKIYLLFGFQNSIFDDVRVMDTRTLKWENLTNSLTGQKPDKRFNFSYGKYKNNIVLYGGASNYLSRIKQRETFNDIWMLSPRTEDTISKQSQWIQLPSVEHTPQRSMMHDGDVYGSQFVIFGGMTKEKTVIDQMLIYDLEALTWVSAVQNKKNPGITLGPKFMHSLTAVIYDKPQKSIPQQVSEMDSEFEMKSYYQTKSNFNNTTVATSSSQIYSRIMWVECLKNDKNGISGLYLFGGMDHLGEVSNEVWHIKPSYHKNLDNLQPNTFEFRENFEKKLFYDVQKVETQGRPPLPRYQHKTVFFQGKYLLIHGGRNNKEAYDQTRNVALNDMALLDLERKTWCVISMLGDIPVSRWNHNLVVVESDKLFMFGGQNLLSFCKATVSCFFTDKKKVSREVQRLHQENEENKIELKKYKFV